MYRVQISAKSLGKQALDWRRLQRLARRILAEEGAGSCEVGVVLTDDEEIRALNQQYLGHDWATDVLAFQMHENGTGSSWPASISSGRELPYLGDLAISLERAREQATDHDHDWAREVELLLVHGMLHLLGYRDDDEASRRRMTARQERLWASFEKSSLLESFGAAIAGLANLFRTQRNVRLHLAAAVLAVALGFWLRLVRWEWAVLVLVIALVFVAEGVNTAIEALLDLVSPEARPLARRSKDVAAAAVLLAAMFALVIGALLFLPHLWEMLP